MPMADDASLSQSVPTSTIIEAASVENSPASKYFWWVGIGALTLAIVAAVAAASYFKKGEWDIVEEMEE